VFVPKKVHNPLARGLLAALVLALTAAVTASAATAASRYSPRIVNPQAAGPVPWQVALVLPNPPRDGLMPVFCGGTIRDASHVITAAHCLEDTRASDLYVAAGFVDRDGLDPTMQRRQVVAITSHPAYDPATTNNDLAILRLAAPLALDGGATTQALPVVAANQNSVGAPAAISGWGGVFSGGPQPPVLLWAYINVYPDAFCGNYGADYTPATMLCAGGFDGEGDSIVPSGDGTIDSCQGDSGGPLARYDGGRTFTLIGVVSWGKGCADAAFPGIYTRLSNPDLNQRAKDPNPPARIEPTAPPAVNGSPTVGQTLTCAGAGWTQQPLTATYRWLTAVVDAEGRPSDVRLEGEGETLALDAGDEGRVVTCTVAVTSLGGAYSQQAQVVGPIGGPLPPPPAPPAPPPPTPPLPPRLDLERPEARYTRERCARQRCRFTVVARDSGGPATRARATYQRLSGCKRGRRGARCRKARSIRVKALGGGVFEIATPKLAPARWRITVVAVDAAGNESKKTSVVVRVRRGRRRRG
jgi:hypothetical protein